MYVNQAGHILMVFATRQAIRAKIGPKLRKQFFLIYQFSSSHVKIDVCPGDDLRTLCPSERVGRSKLIQTNLTEPDVARNVI